SNRRAIAEFSLFILDLLFRSSIVTLWGADSLLGNGSRPLIIVHRSTAGRVAPTGALILAVFNNAGHRGVSAREGKHFRATRGIRLRVVVSKWNALGVVVVPGLLAIRAPRF